MRFFMTCFFPCNQTPENNKSNRVMNVMHFVCKEFLFQLKFPSLHDFLKINDFPILNTFPRRTALSWAAGQGHEAAMKVW